MKRDYDHLFKLVLIGESGAGKSCLLLRFADDAFTESYITTIGVDFRFKTIKVNDGNGGSNDTNIKLQIWDTAGQERFRTITSAYYRGADGIILVYDVSDRQSFQKVDEWLTEVQAYVNETTCKILIGNKSDKDASERQVSTEEGQRKAEELGLAFMETSAKTAENVEASFHMLASQLIVNKEQQPARPGRAGIGAGLLTAKNERGGDKGLCGGCPGAGGGSS